MKGRILLEVRSAQRGASADYLALLSSQSPLAMPSTLEMRSHGLSFRCSLQTGVSLRCRLCPAHAHCDSDEGSALRVMAPAWGMMSENADPLSTAWRGSWTLSSEQTLDTESVPPHPREPTCHQMFLNLYCSAQARQAKTHFLRRRSL